MGMRYDAETRQFMYSKEAEVEDMAKKDQGESENQRMARVCNPCMDAINPDLKFTTESQEDFTNERLPNLDFEIWLKEDKIYHSYYQKPVRTPLVIMERSASRSSRFLPMI